MQQSSWECHSEKCYYVYTVHQKQLGRRLCKQSLFAMLSFIMCIIVSWGLTLYQGYIILTAWYPLQPCHKQSRHTDFKIICITETPSLENSMIFCFKKSQCAYIYIFFFPHQWIYVWKQAKYTCSETYKPNKRLGPVWRNSNFESLTHKQLRIDITIFTPRSFLLKEKQIKKTLLKVFELAHVVLYHVVLDIEWVFRVWRHKISALC